MTKWKTRLFVLLVFVLVFGVGYSYIVAQGTNVRDQSLQKQTTTNATSLGKLQFEIDDDAAVALTNSAFSLQLLPEAGSDSENGKLNQQFNSNTLPVHTKVSVTLNMLRMDCGTIQFMMTPDEHGIYHGEGIPVMPGLWVATATVTYDDQPQDEAIHLAFTFDVK
ncbi:hypothetical protein [Paenibacillus endoradicis]|uniref:hypothetical protein n=1 Tax=Paenibacillus endoradicis TaxID=2972487 RepID=UPI0021595FCA|nr:hypothetical protein [Paenibacillus endoradicis]MCR8656369.1 hypothetical protein [Paenibacillus endoradicis]